MSSPSIPPERVYNPLTGFSTVICRNCGTAFRTRHGRKRYCTDLCYTRSHPCKVAKYPRWSHAEIRQLRALAGTMSGREIARRIGRPHSGTVDKAHQLGISLKRIGEKCPWAKHSDAVVEQARTLFDEGLKARAIAKQLGIPLSTIEKYVYFQKRLGFTPERW